MKLGQCIPELHAAQRFSNHFSLLYHYYIRRYEHEENLLIARKPSSDIEQVQA